MGVPGAAVAHYRAVQRLQALAVLTAEGLWAGVNLKDLSGSWAEQVALLAPAVAGLQVKSAIAGASYGAAALAEQGLYEAPRHFVDPKAFAGVASDGRSLDGLLYSSVPYVKNLIGSGMPPAQALASGRSHLSGVVRTQIADAGRGAAGVDIAARVNTGYVRMLNPPSCDRCSVLAGRFYKWNAGFPRHPRCDCIHVPSTEQAIKGGKSEGLLHDPYEYFEGLSESEQDRVYGRANAQAIRDGGDIFQVVNSKRGMKPGGLVTIEGTTKRGYYGRDKAPRLTPEGIYSQNLSREETQRLLEKNGYLLPGGQNPNGVIRGSGTGFSRESGLTAAERRARTASLEWDAVRAGRNPEGGRLTPEVAARVERNFRKTVLGY